MGEMKRELATVWELDPNFSGNLWSGFVSSLSPFPKWAAVTFLFSHSNFPFPSLHFSSIATHWRVRSGGPPPAYPKMLGAASFSPTIALSLSVVDQEVSNTVWTSLISKIGSKIWTFWGLTWHHKNYILWSIGSCRKLLKYCIKLSSAYVFIRYIRSINEFCI
jgi:hypothetical protein